MKRRLAAEWEPAIGVMVAWPPVIPHTLFVELAKDTTLHILISDASVEADARKTLGRWGIDQDAVDSTHLLPQALPVAQTPVEQVARHEVGLVLEPVVDGT